MKAINFLRILLSDLTMTKSFHIGWRELTILTAVWTPGIVWPSAFFLFPAAGSFFIHMGRLLFSQRVKGASAKLQSFFCAVSSWYSSIFYTPKALVSVDSDLSPQISKTDWLCLGFLFLSMAWKLLLGSKLG